MRRGEQPVDRGGITSLPVERQIARCLRLDFRRAGGQCSRQISDRRERPIMDSHGLCGERTKAAWAAAGGRASST
jgi:hypothetical protein